MDFKENLKIKNYKGIKRFIYKLGTVMFPLNEKEVFLGDIKINYVKYPFYCFNLKGKSHIGIFYEIHTRKIKTLKRKTYGRKIKLYDKIKNFTNTKDRINYDIVPNIPEEVLNALMKYHINTFVYETPYVTYVYIAFETNPLTNELFLSEKSIIDFEEELNNENPNVEKLEIFIFPVLYLFDRKNVKLNEFKFKDIFRGKF